MAGGNGAGLMRSVSSTVMLCMADVSSDTSGEGNSSGVIAGDETISSAADASISGMAGMCFNSASACKCWELYDLELLLCGGFHASDRVCEPASLTSTGSRERSMLTTRWNSGDDPCGGEYVSDALPTKRKKKIQSFSIRWKINQTIVSCQLTSISQYFL